MHSNFELGFTKFKNSAGGLTLIFQQNFYHVSVKINNATFLENKGITCSSVYVATSQCSSTAIKMDVVTIFGGVCLTNNTSMKGGELLFVYGTRVSCKNTLKHTHYTYQQETFQRIPYVAKADNPAYVLILTTMIQFLCWLVWQIWYLLKTGVVEFALIMSNLQSYCSQFL